MLLATYIRTLYDGECMQYIGTSKISKLNPKPNLTYPLIRLPQNYKSIIGKTAHMYELSDEGQTNIVLVFDETENQEKVIKPVIKQNAESDFSARISVLEEETRELRTLIEKETHFFTYIQKSDVLARIRIGDLRRVKAQTACSQLQITSSPSHNQLDHESAVFGHQALSEIALPFTENELLDLSLIHI